MITLGIDLSSQPKDTAACLIEWFDGGGSKVSEPVLDCDDASLDSLVNGADAIGIDAPLGWPVAFVSAVNGWVAESWTIALRDELRFRQTDREVMRFIEKKHRLTPLSVTSDRIALPAMRAMALLRRHGVTDKGGDGRFFEVYPAGSLAVWGLNRDGYKGTKATALEKRRAMLQSLCQSLPSAAIPDDYALTDHAMDALIASLTARAAKLRRTRLPSEDQRPAAMVEGWIHLPESENILASTSC